MRTTTNILPRRPLAAVTAGLAALAIASLGLAACGSSSGGASGSNATAGNTTARSATTGSATTGSAAVRNGAAAKALRAFRQHARVAKSLPPATRPGLTSPGAVRFRQALAKFAACLRQNGVNVPGPNSSGHAPLFSIKGVNTASPQFKAATAKCRTALTSALRGRP